MKRLIVSLVCVFAIACASLPKRPDGSLDVQTLLSWAEDGIIADCAIQGADATICSIGLPSVRALESKSAADVKAGLQAIVMRFPTIAPYLNWLINDLA